MESTFNSILKPVLKSISDELRKKENRDKIFEHIIDPIICDIKSRYQSYVTFLAGILLVILIMQIVIIYLIKAN